MSARPASSADLQRTDGFKSSLGSGHVIVSYPEHDGCSESDGRQEHLGTPVVSGCNPTPILDPAEHDFDAVSPFVSSLVVSDSLLSLLPARDAGAYPFVFQRFSKPNSVVSAIPQQPIDIWQAAHQCPCADVVADLPGSGREADRSTQAVADGVQLRVHASWRKSMGPEPKRKTLGIVAIRLLATQQAPSTLPMQATYPERDHPKNRQEVLERERSVRIAAIPSQSRFPGRWSCGFETQKRPKLAREQILTGKPRRIPPGH